jgi:hypothetical protein
MAKTTNRDSTTDQGSPEAVERGINILTNSQPIIVEGAEEAIEKYEKGELTPQELYDIILDAPIAYIDRSKTSQFKESKDTGSADTE